MASAGAKPRGEATALSAAGRGGSIRRAHGKATGALIGLQLEQTAFLGLGQQVIE